MRNISPLFNSVSAAILRHCLAVMFASAIRTTVEARIQRSNRCLLCFLDFSFALDMLDSFVEIAGRFPAACRESCKLKVPFE